MLLRFALLLLLTPLLASGLPAGGGPGRATSLPARQPGPRKPFPHFRPAEKRKLRHYKPKTWREKAPERRPPTPGVAPRP